MQKKKCGYYLQYLNKGNEWCQIAILNKSVQYYFQHRGTLKLLK